MQARVLALSPHTDDVELGAGGFLYRLAGEGSEVHVVAFARAASLNGDDSLAEWNESLKHLYVAPERQRFWGYQDTRLPAASREILDRLVALRDELCPDVVLVPAPHDVHQDHQVITQEAIRAFKRQRLLGYDLVWNAVGTITLDWFVQLTEHQIERKEEALSRYQSQKGRPFFKPGLVRAIAAMRGEQCGQAYAEAFDCIRWRM